MVRIRYVVNETVGELVSKTIESSQGVLRSRINRDHAVWRVVVEKAVAEENGGLSWSEITVPDFTKNLAVAKGKAKRALKELGVHFLEEVRRRSNA